MKHIQFLRFIESNLKYFETFMKSEAYDSNIRFGTKFSVFSVSNMYSF